MNAINTVGKMVNSKGLGKVNLGVSTVPVKTQQLKALSNLSSVNSAWSKIKSGQGKISQQPKFN